MALVWSIQGHIPCFSMYIVYVHIYTYQIFVEGQNKKWFNLDAFCISKYIKAINSKSVSFKDSIEYVIKKNLFKMICYETLTKTVKTREWFRFVLTAAHCACLHDDEHIFCSRWAQGLYILKYFQVRNNHIVRTFGA